MIMADQDHDGSHIKGLVVNIIHTFWPSLLDVPGFLQQFITPIVKVSKGKKSNTFFTLPQYMKWRESTGNDGKGWKAKYYKGLGTSTSAEAKEYFSNLDLHEIPFVTLSKDTGTQDAPINLDEDGEDDFMAEQPVPDNAVSSASGSDLIDMVFNKKRVSDRKEWLNNLKKDTFLDYSNFQETGLKYSDFINKELILFSKSDCARSIPHVMDGFKPSQRKILFACFKRKLKEEIKVAQLAGYIGEHSAYHHGEASLHGAIIGMAQSFVGSNNINLLTPGGQFGTRRMGGKDAASPRYIFTKLENITRAIFHPDDDELLTYLNDDGVSIEPEHYMPVIPMVLVNGSDGIGTGWSSSVHNYDPRTIVANIRHMIQGEELERMEPCYSGFSGEIESSAPSKFTVRGNIERLNDTTLHISELPIRKWTQDYKQFLEAMTIAEKAGTPELKTFNENHTDTTVSFTLTADKENIDAWEKFPKGGLHAKFKLIGSLSTSNMHLFDTEDSIIKYAEPEDILKEFFELRMEFYGKRKDLLLQKLRREQKMLSNKARFVEEVCSGDLVVSNRKKIDLLNGLKEGGYELFDKNDKHDDTEDMEEEEDTSVADLSKGYEYLLGMKIWSLTFEKAQELRQQLDERTAELRALENKEPSEIWLNDLDEIEIALGERDDGIKADANAESKAQKKNQKHQQKKKAAAKRGKKKVNEWESDMEDSDQDNDSDMSDEEVKKTTSSRRKPTAIKQAAKPTKPTKPAKLAATRAKPAAITKAKSTPAAMPKSTAAAKVKVVSAPAAEKEPEDDVINLTLAERMAKKLMVSPPTKKATKPAPIDMEIPAQPTFSDDEDAGSSSSGSRKRPSPRNEDSDSDIEVMEAPKPKAKRAKASTARATKKKVAPKKKAPEPEDSEDDFDFSSEDEDVVVVEKTAAARRVGGRARMPTKKPASYVFDSDSDSECSFSD
jgi:DNA topoisomerase-2